MSLKPEYEWTTRDDLQARMMFVQYRSEQGFLTLLAGSF